MYKLTGLGVAVSAYISASQVGGWRGGDSQVGVGNVDGQGGVMGWAG